ncbi:hypothetical protein [Microbacterium sp. MMO-10]|uniref:hypothetical protein n=1 Tax=Microbacterium sp. MMO-10 TaxID=3081272 RepID=UPI003015BB09
MARSQAIRFTFAIASGDNAGLGAGQFRVWCHGDDTYIADAGVPQWKTSLHGEIAWRTAETAESHSSPEARLPGETDRAPWKYTPPDFVDGQRLAFVVGATRAALAPWSVPERYQRIEVRDRWDELTKANIWMTQADAEVPDHPFRIGPILELASGTRVWASVGREYLEPIDPEPAPTSTMLEPQIPGVHDVTAPGVLIRGVHLPGRSTDANWSQLLRRVVEWSTSTSTAPTASRSASRRTRVTGHVPNAGRTACPSRPTSRTLAFGSRSSAQTTV